MHVLISSHIQGKKKYDTNNQCATLFSRLCSVSDEAFGRFTIEKCWDIWLKEWKEELNKNNFWDSDSDKKKDKIEYQYAVKKSNERFGDWTSDGMKGYNEIANLVKSDWIMNKKVEIEYKDFIHRKMYNNEENQQTFPFVILSDIHEKLANTCLPNNNFENPYITNQKEFTVTKTTGEKHTSHQKRIWYLIHFCQMKCAWHNRAINITADQMTIRQVTDQESDDENFDDKNQVTCNFILAKGNQMIPNF